MDKILKLSEQFKWAPSVMRRASLLGYEIFALAQDSYIKYDERNSKKAEQLLQRVKSLEAGLNVEGFKYNTKEEVYRMYKNELDECILDVNVARGDFLKLSKRMEKYIG